MGNVIIHTSTCVDAEENNLLNLVSIQEKATESGNEFVAANTTRPEPSEPPEPPILTREVPSVHA